MNSEDGSAAAPVSTGPLDIRRVMAALPHRYPMLLVDRVEELIPDRSIVAMHDLDLAARYADRLVLMDGGAIVADGEPEAILESRGLSEVFGIERVDGSWRASSPHASHEEDVSRSEGRRSSR